MNLERRVFDSQRLVIDEKDEADKIKYIVSFKNIEGEIKLSKGEVYSLNLGDNVIYTLQLLNILSKMASFYVKNGSISFILKETKNFVTKFSLEQ